MPLIVKILTCLLSMSTIIQLARENDPTLKEMKGIVIAPDSPLIPQEVIFIPYEYNEEQPVSTCLSEAILDQRLTAYEIYFQGMRTMTPDLQVKINSQKDIKGSLDSTLFEGNNVKILLGVIAFSKQSLQWTQFSQATREYNFQLKVAENTYPLHVVYNVNLLGIPQFFEVPGK